MTLPTNAGLTPPPGPDRETRRELAKLTANYVNAAAVSIFAIGALAPPVTLMSNPTPGFGVAAIGALSLSAFVLSLVVHLVARYLLRREFLR